MNTTDYVFNAIAKVAPPETSIAAVRAMTTAAQAVFSTARLRELSDIGVEVRHICDLLTKDRVEGEDPRVAESAISRLVQRIQSGDFAKEK